MKRQTYLQEIERKPGIKPLIGGWAGLLLRRLRATRRHEPRLQLLERITLAPRQSLALVEADGRRLLVATSADGGPAFYALDSPATGMRRGPIRDSSHLPVRISW